MPDLRDGGGGGGRIEEQCDCPAQVPASLSVCGSAGLHAGPGEGGELLQTHVGR